MSEFTKWVPEYVPNRNLSYPPMHRDFRAHPGKWIDPEIDRTVRTEAGVIVQCGTERPTRVGRGTWLMIGSHVGHDAQIGERCEIADNCVVGAHARIGDGVKLGIGTIIRPRITVGDGARTGCGAVVVKDIPPGEVWVGNPARKLDRDVEITDAWEQIRAEAEGLTMWSEWWQSTRA